MQIQRRIQEPTCDTEAIDCRLILTQLLTDIPALFLAGFYFHFHFITAVFKSYNGCAMLSSYPVIEFIFFASNDDSQTNYKNPAQKHHKNPAETLQESCRNTTRILQKHYKNPAGGLLWK